MIKRAAFFLVIFMLVVYTVFPFYWAVNSSLQPPDRVFDTPADYLAVPPDISSFRSVFSRQEFLLALRNSAMVASGATLLSLVSGALAACALGRFRMRGRRFVLSVILAMTIFPQITVVGALHQIISNIGLYNNPAGLIISYMIFTLPFTVWVLTNFFESLPRELEESAYVDGASPLQTFLQIMLPLSTPAVATTGLLAFIAAWNEFLFAQSLTNTPQAQTVPVIIANFPGDTMHEIPWGSIMAASVVVTVPLVILVFVFQRRIVAGLTAGAVKG